MAEELRLEVLGGLRITRGGAPVDFVSSKAPALLVYLAVTGRLHYRAALAALLWSEHPEEDARRNLRVVLANLRQTLAPHLLITREAIAFDRAGDYWLDVDQFEAALQAESPVDVSRLQAAVRLYRGDFLEGFYVREAPAFDEWATAQRERLRQLALNALHELVSYHTDQHEYAAGLDACTRLLGLDPWREDAHRQLMMLLALSGQQSAALAQYDACRRVLEAELGAEPSEETTRLYQRIRAGELAPPSRATTRHDLAPARERFRPPTLPAPPTGFIGRETELAQIAVRLAGPSCRLLTLIGPGGIGKTRLALEAAARHAAGFRDGVAFVPLASATSLTQMMSAMADALGVTFVEQRDARLQLLAYLRDRHMLLVLDNLEQLPEGAGLIAIILETAPAVVILATSRERLNLQSEWLLDVHGLSYPLAEALASGDLANPEPLETYNAVELFTQRATQVQPQFALTDAIIPAVIRICQLVEGVPLGIELAAAWVRTVPSAQIAEEIASNLDFLATTLWDVPARHRSLRAVFDHSWQLLNNTERVVLAQLTVFRGGFGSEAARQVSRASLPQLAALVDKSLLGRDAEGRYTLHELLRQFAAERLQAGSPDLAVPAQSQHSAFYLDLLAKRHVALNGRAPQPAIAELRAELGNIRVAWQWAVDHAESDALSEASSALADFYDLTGLFQEGAAVFGAATEQLQAHLLAPAGADRSAQLVLGTLLVVHARFLTRQAQFGRALEVVEEAAELARTTEDMRLEAIACQQRGDTLWRQADYAAARPRLERALLLARTVGLPRVEADSLLSLGEAAMWQGDLGAAPVYQEQALQSYRAAGNRRGEGSALNLLGLLALWQGNVAAAQTYQEQALECRRATGNRSGEGFVLTCLGHIALARRDYGQARACYDEAILICRAIGDRLEESVALACLGYVPFYCGDYHGARACFEHALQIHRELRDRRGESDMLANLGLIAHLLGDDRLALDYCRQALQLARDLGNQPFQARALTFLGHAWAGLDQLEEAAGAYREAVDLRRAVNQPHLAMEPLAGLARLALAQGNLAQARAYTVEIRPFLASGKLDGAFEPLRVYLTCYQVLRAASDLDAARVLRAAHRLLQEWADGIQDAGLRDSFLEAVAVHREIAREYAQLSNDREAHAVMAVR